MNYDLTFKGRNEGTLNLVTSWHPDPVVEEEVKEPEQPVAEPKIINETEAAQPDEELTQGQLTTRLETETEAETEAEPVDAA